MNYEKKQKAFGIIFSFLSVGINMIIGVVYTPILLSNLGQSQYGIYSLCISVMGYLTIMNAGANAAYVRYYVQSKNNVEKLKIINGIFLKLFSSLAISALFFGMLITVFSPVLFGGKITANEYIIVKKCFVLLSMIVAVEIITCFYNSLLIANEKFYFVKGFAVISSVLKPLITIPFLLKGYDCTFILYVRLVISFLVLVMHIIYCNKSIGIKIKFKSYEKVIYFEIIQFVFFIVLQSVFDQFNWQIDQFILARVKGANEISIYSVGSTLNSYYITIAAAVTNVFIAEVNRNINNSIKVNDILQKTSRIIGYVVFTIMVAYALIGDYFIEVWAGREYLDSFWVGLLLMLPITFSLPLGVGQDIARAKNKHQRQIVYNLMVCIINVLVSIPLAAKIGAVGSAIGTFCSEIIICWIIQPVYYIKYLELDVKNVYKQLLQIVPSLLPGAGYLIVLRVLGLIASTWTSIIIHITIYLILSSLSFLAFSFNSDERKKLRYLLGIKK